MSMSNKDLEELVKKSAATYAAMSPEQRAEHDKAQRESFIRAFVPAGEGMSKEQIEARISEINKAISEVTCWGAALTELNEERQELEAALKGIEVK